MPRRPVRLDETSGFPDPRGAVVGGMHDGLVAVGGDLGIGRLLQAYRSGIFPWTADPVSWWSPDPRGIFELGGLHIGRSLRRTLRQSRFRVTRDRDFAGVIRACATIRRPGGWIRPEFVTAYTALHREGHAHSVECWLGDDLVGGVYGVSVGGLFAGESMFHRASDASKVAVVHLHDHLVSRGYGLFDIQMLTDATRALGAREISRDEYLGRLKDVVDLPVRFG
ncbi:MAG: leucyl/phenylalanyl-tRNA--protein transferase [Limisphaerales bacterium]